MAKDSRGSTGSSRSSGRKRRSPTIDLSAEEVTRGADETAGAGGVEPPTADAGPSGTEETAAGRPAAGTQTQAAESPAGPARSPAEQPRPEPEQPIPSAFALPPRAGAEGAAGRPTASGAGPRRGALTAGFVAAALAGGLIALAGLFLLDRAGQLPLRDGTEETAALRDRAAELEQELAAARQAAELAREDLQDQLADLNERVAELAQAAPAETGAPGAGLDEEVARLQAALTALRDQVGGTAPPAALEDIDARLRQVEETAGRLAGLADQVEALGPAPGEAAGQVEERLDQLGDELGRLAASFEQLQDKIPAERDVAAVKDDVAALANRMGALENQLTAAAPAERLEELEAQLGQVLQRLAQVESLAPAVAAQGLAAALEAGRPFERDLDGIRALGIEDPALSRLEPYAETGLPSRSALRRRFQELMPQISESAELPPESGTLERLWQSAQQIVEVRPAGPQQGDSPAAVASRIDAALQAGDLRRALEEWQDLPPDAQAASQDWAAEADALLAGEALAERLRSDALAALSPRD